jgi:hypothetical protein
MWVHIAATTGENDCPKGQRHLVALFCNIGCACTLRQFGHVSSISKSHLAIAK